MSHETLLIDALQQPAAYPHHPREVRFLQTHISLLFFAGGCVYKVKKPVDMGFLDYTTIEKRRHFCEEEVRLNSRLAPGIYLGVVRIVRDQDNAIRIERDDGAEDETIDYAVEMVRLPEGRMLPNLIDRDEVGDQEMRAIAELLVDFHTNCATGDEVNRYATVDSLRQQTRENVDQLRGLMEATAPSAALIEHLSDWCERSLDEHSELIEQRITRGRVREGHGDLHAGNICLLEEKIVIYDCIEFTPKFRCRDVAAELGFLAMDMDFRGHGVLGQTLIEHYAQRASDEQMLGLLGFFKVHFAIVRAKVAALKSAEEEVEPAERREAADEARRYLALAVGYSVTPSVIIMCGLPATGKSTVARLLARPLNAEMLRADEIRKQLAGMSPTDRGDASIYSEEMTDRTYARIGELTFDAIVRGKSVIVDATFASARRRKRVISIARDASVPWALLLTTADEQTIRQRMAARAADNHEVSDADWAVYETLRDHFQPPEEVGENRRVTVTGTTDRQEAVELTLLTLARQASRTPRRV